MVRISSEAVARTPDPAKQMVMLVRAHERLGDLKGALRWAEQVHTRRPDGAMALRIAKLRDAFKKQSSTAA